MHEVDEADCEKRARHQAPDLVWDADLAQQAKDWADHMVETRLLFVAYSKTHAFILKTYLYLFIFKTYLNTRIILLKLMTAEFVSSNSVIHL